MLSSYIIIIYYHHILSSYKLSFLKLISELINSSQPPCRNAVSEINSKIISSGTETFAVAKVPPPIRRPGGLRDSFIYIDLVPDMVHTRYGTGSGTRSGTRCGSRYGTLSGTTATRFVTRSGIISGTRSGTRCGHIWYQIHIDELISKASRLTYCGGLGDGCPPREKVVDFSQAV